MSLDIQTIIETAIECGATVQKAKYGCIGYYNEHGNWVEVAPEDLKEKRSR